MWSRPLGMGNDLSQGLPHEQNTCLCQFRVFSLEKAFSKSLAVITKSIVYNKTCNAALGVLLNAPVTRIHPD